MPLLAPFRVVQSPLLTVLASLAPLATAQRVAVLEGPASDQLRVVVHEPFAPGSPTTVLLPQILIHEPRLLGRTSNEQGELDSPRLVVRRNVPRIELPNGDRLFVYERKDVGGHGLLLVPASGHARIVHSSLEQLDLPLAIGADLRHIAFVRDEELVVVKLDGGVFAATGTGSRILALPDSVVAESLVVGNDHAFVVVDAEAPGTSDRLLRCDLATGSVADVTPFGVAADEIEPTLAIAGNGSLVAFLRSRAFGDHDVWVIGATGAARQVPLPEREYRPSTWIPFGEGHAHLLLNGDGSRLMVTEAAGEDELYYVDTAPGGAVMHVTGNALFASYIGVHILPRFRGNRLLMASGHAGWKDWYALQPNGEVLNLTGTGSPEPPFLLGSLDASARFDLANGRSLATEWLGTTLRLRTLDPAGGSTVLFTDLSAPPSAGGAVGGPPDLRIVGTGGERLVSGLDGGLLLQLPPGIRLGDAVRSSSGWRGVYASLPGGPAVFAVLLPDGAIALGGVGTTPPQLVATTAGELAVLWADRLDAFAVTGVASVPLPAAAIRVALSGVGD